MHAGNSRGRLPDDQAGLVVEVFRMLADATRVQVLWSLTEGEMSVNELAEHVGKPAPSVSQHLAKLRMARLVRTRREGTTIFYSLENDHVRQLVIDAVFHADRAQHLHRVGMQGDAGPDLPELGGRLIDRRLDARPRQRVRRHRRPG